MKNFFLLLMCLWWGASLLTAQENPSIHRVENTQQEIWALFDVMNVKVFRFDLKELASKNYRIAVYIDEYTAGEERRRENLFSLGRNWKDLPEDPEERAKLLADNPVVSVDSMRMLKTEAMSVSIMPEDDTTAMLGVSIYGIGLLRSPLKVKILEGQNKPLYDTRPFIQEAITEKKQEIPLALYSSFWKDEKWGFYRSCMENELNPDLSNEAFAFIPHYYVIGLELSEE